MNRIECHSLKHHKLVEYHLHQFRGLEGDTSDRQPVFCAVGVGAEDQVHYEKRHRSDHEEYPEIKNNLGLIFKNIYGLKEYIHKNANPSLRQNKNFC